MWFVNKKLESQEAHPSLLSTILPYFPLIQAQHPAETDLLCDPDLIFQRHLCIDIIKENMKE